MKSILTSLLVTLSLSLFAQFSGSYDPANWTQTNSPGDNGYVDASGAPASVQVVSSDAGCCFGSTVSYEVTVHVCGTITFDWSYNSQDCNGQDFDPFGYKLNGNFYQLSVSCGFNCGWNQSGSASVTVAAGDVFGLYAYSSDNYCGRSYTTVSNFNAPSADCYDDEGNLKVELCHNGRSICVAPSAVAAHLAHGDVLGTCEENAACEDEGNGGAFVANLPGVKVDIDNAIQSRSLETESIEIYPNPAEDVVNIKSNRISGQVTISIFNISGQQVSTIETSISRGAPVQLDVKDLINGSYELRIEAAQGSYFTEKLIVNRTKN